MIKKDQIEEMAKDYYGYSIDSEADCKFVAEEMYNKGHRKLSDGATVLLVGKYNQPLDEKTIEYFIKHNEQIRKETAREILNELIDSSNKITFFDCKMALGLDKLAKQFGVKIKE